MLWRLAKEITNSSQLRTLGLKLELDNSKIDTALFNHRNDTIEIAAYDVLRQWKYSQEDATVAYGKICKALRAAELNVLIPKVLQRPEQHLNRAYFEACREGTKKVYNARMILAGYSEAGKTSLATRLLGGTINVDEKKSTEGIALHRIESTFNNKVKQKKGGKWTEKPINTSDLRSIFSHAVWSRVKKMSSEGSSGKSSTDRKRQLTEKKEEDDHGSEAKRRKTEDGSPLSRPSSEPEEAFKLQTISGETIEELIDNKNVTVKPESEEETPFTLSVWDLGGQDEFISTHHLFLNTEATILIVMDITKGLHRLIGGKSELGYLNSPAEILQYWLNLFHNDAEKYGKTDKLNVAIVLTHTDLIEGDQEEYIDGYKKQMMGLIEGKPYGTYIDETKIYPVNNATGSDTDFEKLRDELFQHLIKQEIWGFEMEVRWFKLKEKIIRKSNQKGEQYMNLYEIWELAEELGMNTHDVEEFLKKQTTLGDFVYFPDMRDLVITDPQWLVDKCKDLITVHDFIDKRNLPAKLKSDLKEGKITENGLIQLWKDKCVVVFLIKLMEKYDLLVDVSDGLERKYIIPCMLSSNIHKGEPSKVMIGSFPQFLSKCSKEKNWKLTQKDLSYTNATLDIGDNVKLSLSLSQPVQIQTQFLWPKNMDAYDRDKIQRETKASLARILKTCQIQTAEDEGRLLMDLLLESQFNFILPFCFILMHNAQTGDIKVFFLQYCILNSCSL